MDNPPKIKETPAMTKATKKDLVTSNVYEAIGGPAVT